MVWGNRRVFVEEWMELRVVLLLELIGFVNIMKVEFNRKREFKDDFMVFDMNNWIA